MLRCVIIDTNIYVMVLKMKSKKSKIIFIASLCVFLISLTVLVVYMLPTIFAPKKKETVSKPSTPSVSSQEPLPDNPKNFDELEAQNPDIYAWISVPGTAVDYPVVQSGEDKPENFYLNHGLDGKYLFAGCIYTQRLNNKDFHDPNTVLYGHNMMNGSMFGTLLDFRNVDFFNQNKYIYIYTRGHILTYQIYAAYRFDNRHLLNSFNLYDPKVFEEYLEITKNPKSLIMNIDSSVQLDVNSRIITLSTCITNDNYRYLVQGVLIDDQPTN